MDLVATTALVLALVAAATQVPIVTTNAQIITGGGAAAQNQTGATPETTSMTAAHFTAQNCNLNSRYFTWSSNALGSSSTSTKN
jgi:hypothetical protein